MQARARQLGGDLIAAGAQIEEAAAENDALQRRVEAAGIEVATLQGNLGRLDGYVEQLESQSQSLRQELQTAADEKETLAGNLGRMGDELDALRRENQVLAHKVDAAESRGEELKAQVQSLLHQLGETQSLHKQLVAAEDELRAATEQVHALQSKLSTVRQVLDYTGKNQLLLIRGIGPTYARRLNEAGIQTLNDLARQSPERLREIVELKKWQAIETEEWIDEAQTLSIKPDGEGAPPATADSQPATSPSQNAE